jgi:transposase-like protein
MASKFGCTPETLRKWVRRAERDSSHRGGLTTHERQVLKDLDRDNRELRRSNESCAIRPPISRRRGATADRSDDPVHRRSPGYL